MSIRHFGNHPLLPLGASSCLGGSHRFQLSQLISGQHWPHRACCSSGIAPEAVVGDPVHGHLVVDAGAEQRAPACFETMRAEHRPDAAGQHLPKQSPQALSVGGFRQWPPRTGRIERTKLVQGLATPIGLSMAICPASTRAARGLRTALCRQLSGSQQCRWWLPWRIFTFLRDAPYSQY